MAGKRGAETAKSGIHPATPPLPRLMPAHVVIHARSGTTGGRVELDTARARLTDSAQSSATTAPTSASPVLPGPGAGGSRRRRTAVSPVARATRERRLSSPNPRSADRATARPIELDHLAHPDCETERVCGDEGRLTSVALEPMMTPSNALVSGRGLRVVEAGGTFRAAFRIGVEEIRKP